MKETYTDADLGKILGTNRAESAIIDQKIQEAYARIREQSDQNKVIDIKSRKVVQVSGRNGKRYSKKGTPFWKKAAGSFGAAAAAFVLAMIFCAANPTLAAEIPVIGSVFSKVQGLFSFGGIPEDETVYLQDNLEESGDEGEDNGTDASTGKASQGLMSNTGISGVLDNNSMPQYQAEDLGITVTLTEYYASNQAIFVGVRVENEEPFPKMVSFSNYQLLQLFTDETYSFRDAGNEVIRGFRDLEGQLENENTFVGVMRIDYDSIKWDYKKYDEAVAEADKKGEPYPEINDDTFDDWIKEYEVPENFRMKLQVNGFRIYPQQMEQGGEPYNLKGTWDIPAALDIRQSSANSAIIRIDETNTEGIGLEYIEISSVELALHIIQNVDEDRLAVAVAFDKDGRRIESGGTNFHDLAIYGHDISVITVYVCDYMEFMDELKGYSLQGDEAFRKVLEERALYKKTIDTTRYLQQE